MSGKRSEYKIFVKYYEVTGADPGILHGRWLMGSMAIPIVSYTGGSGWLVNKDGCLLYYSA
jgi:hypothetical protein